MRRRVVALCVLLAGCPRGDGDDDVRDTPDDSAADDSDTPPDTDLPGPTGDTDTTSETADTAVASQPPSDWGGGLVDLTSTVWAADPMTLFAGSTDPVGSPQGTTVAFGDLDGDGRREFLTSKALYPSGPTEQGVRVYQVAPGGLVRDAGLEAAVATSNDVVVGVFDVDDDGVDDVLYSTPGGLVRFGAGDGSFGERYLPQGLEALDVWYHVGPPLPWDLDRDGWLDLLFTDIECFQPDTYLPALRTGPRAWTWAQGTLDESAKGRPEGLVAMRLASGEERMIMAGPACSGGTHGGFLDEVSRDALGLPLYEDTDPTPADVYWKLEPRSAGLPFTVLAPMGAATSDLDADGFLDVLVTLAHPRLAVLAGDGQGGLRDESRLTFSITPGRGLPEVPWGVATPDLDQDGIADLSIAMGDDVTSLGQLEGFSFPTRVWWGHGDFTFVDVTDAVGAGLQGSWHGMVLEDLDADGDADLAYGGWGVPPVLYRNAIDTGNHGLSIGLRGTTSNHLGVGARVIVRAPGLPERVHHVGDQGNPLGLSRPDVFAGLGPHEAADEVEILWPSGHRQIVTGLAAGTRHELEEPVTIALSETDRHLPADGTSEATVTITPRAVDGTLDPAVGVTLTLEGAAATVVTPLAHDGAGTWTATLRAPESAGVTRIVVAFDGVPRGVAPKLWWDEPAP